MVGLLSTRCFTALQQHVQATQLATQWPHMQELQLQLAMGAPLAGSQVLTVGINLITTAQVLPLTAEVLAH